VLDATLSIGSSLDSHKVEKDLFDKYNFFNCPSNYQELKYQAAVLSRLSDWTFMVMAQRLHVINEKRLYEQDGYKDFKSFIYSELNVTSRTVYNYLNILSAFGKTLYTQEPDFAYSALLPALPLLTSPKLDRAAKAKQHIRLKLLKLLADGDRDRLNSTISRLKQKWGIEMPITQAPTSFDKHVQKFLNNIPKRLTLNHRALLSTVRDHIDNLL
jgi:hypothetical protein